MFDYNEYLKASRDRIINALLVADYATITEKLMRHEYRGDNNEAWKIGPVISAGANREDITKLLLDSIPYCIGVSSGSGKLLKELSTETIPEYSKGGGLALQFQERSSYELLSLLTIPIQFSLLEYYEFSCYQKHLENGAIFSIDEGNISLKTIGEKGLDKIVKGRIEHFYTSYQRKTVTKRISHWSDINIKVLDKSTLELYERLSTRRNALVHEVDFEAPTISEAIQYFKECRCIASSINNCFQM